MIERSVLSFHKRLEFIKNSYYLNVFGVNDVFKYSVRYVDLDRIVSLFGLDFKYVFGRERLELFRVNYCVIELISMLYSLFRYMDSINKRGYVTDGAVEKTFIYCLGEFFADYGFEPIKLGNSELTYTL
jgi:hypothetical protein